MTSKELNTITKHSLRTLIELLKEDEKFAKSTKDNYNESTYKFYRTAIQKILYTIKEEE